MMTTHRSSANRHDKRQVASGTTLPHGSQPGSPTLTNPDMILPDYNDLVGYNDLPRPPRSMWDTGHSIEDGFHFSDNGFYVNPDPLSTPIIYGNGTMLSDIGEVTEVESNAGTVPSRTPSRRPSRSPDDEARLSKNLGRNRLRYVKRDRRLSNDSTSTRGTTERTAFADFDDALSVGADSVFQGDDEESVASYAEESAMAHSLHSARKLSVRRLSDELSANSMSKRAEEILANAKQRLTDMEDNLSRARSLSYHTATDDSTSSVSSLGRSASTSYRGPVSSAVASVHSRNMSENGFANSRNGGPLPQRSASALGSAGGYRRTLPTSRSADAIKRTTDRGAHTLAHGHFDMPLEPLDEDDYTESITGRMGDLGTSNFGSSFDAGSARSSVQVRDLQDQMNGLKGKISSLRDRARVDSLKRRSLQSLRTPSLFTSAAWDPEYPDARSLYPPESNSDPARVEGTNGHSDFHHTHEHDATHELKAEPPVKGRTAAQFNNQQGLAPCDVDQSLLDQVTTAHGEDNGVEEANDDDDDNASCYSGDGRNTPTNNKPRTDAGDQKGYESESGESMYHDTYQHQVSHEDREDAFDYEHFFLHSAMGNIRCRSGSLDSTDSVETARGPEAPRRRPSTDTTASVESFRTAEEGVASRSPTALGYRVYTPAELFEGTRPSSVSSFRDSSSGSDSTATLSERRRRQSAMSHRPASVASVSTRPSCSSFESTGTNRSFPLISKSKRNGGMLTPGSSPDQVKRTTPKTTVKDETRIEVKEIGGRGQSPAIQLLSPADQASVEGLVAGLGKCILVLGEAGGTATGAHEVYRRRIEAARRILEGGMDMP